MLWRVFCALSGARHWTDSGSPQAITFADIDAWCRLQGRRLSSLDLAALRVLDSEFRAAMSESLPAADDEDWSD